MWVGEKWNERVKFYEDVMGLKSILSFDDKTILHRILGLDE
jgi:hypothetical protein